jgi:hypothetical protein
VNGELATDDIASETEQMFDLAAVLVAAGTDLGRGSEARCVPDRHGSIREDQ